MKKLQAILFLEWLRVMKNQSKAFFSLDLLFTTLVLFFMFSQFLLVSYNFLFLFKKNIEDQIIFNKLLSASSYIVKVYAAKKSDEIFPNNKIYPNLITKNDFREISKNLSEILNFNLTVTLNENEIKEKRMCIYRLVILNETQEIKKIYFCSD